jgi:hypothetical protein
MDEITSTEIKKASPTLFKDWVTIYRLHRDRVVQEDSLINYRMTWMLLSQTILLGLWGGLFAAEITNFDKLTAHYIEYSILKFFEGALSFAAVVAAIGSWITLRAAIDEIERVKCLYEKAKTKFSYASAPDEEIFGMITGRRIHHIWGHIITKWGPWFFVSVWVTLFIIFVGRLFNTQDIGVAPT